MKPSLLSLFLGLIACSPEWSRPQQSGSWSPPSTAYVCIDLPKEQLASARAAVNSWDYSLARWRHLVPIQSHIDDCTYWVHEVSEPRDIGWVVAWATLGGRDVSMRKGWYEFDTTSILLHELGHALGAQHVPGTLMNPSYQFGVRACPDVVTVAQVAAWNHVDLGLLRWCY